MPQSVHQLHQLLRLAECRHSNLTYYEICEFWQPSTRYSAFKALASLPTEDDLFSAPVEIQLRIRSYTVLIVRLCT